MNLLQSMAGQMTGKGAGAQDAKKADAAADAAAFQKMLLKVASSPSVQRASLLASEGINDSADAAQKMGGLASRILQDPAAQQAIDGAQGAVDIKLMSDGFVMLKMADGRQKTVRLQGDAREAAEKAATILNCLKKPEASGGMGGAIKSAAGDALAFRYEQGTGSAVL